MVMLKRRNKNPAKNLHRRIQEGRRRARRIGDLPEASRSGSGSLQVPNSTKWYFSSCDRVPSDSYDLEFQFLREGIADDVNFGALGGHEDRIGQTQPCGHQSVRRRTQCGSFVAAEGRQFLLSALPGTQGIIRSSFGWNLGSISAGLSERQRAATPANKPGVPWPSCFSAK